MNYRIICVGKIKEKFYRDEIDNIVKRIRQKGDHIEIVELNDNKIPDNIKGDKINSFLEKECEPMHAKIEKQDYVIALCIEGKEMNTEQHKEYIEKAVDMGRQRIVYIIGGSLGIAQSVKERADLKLSFSKMTFPHQLMRMVLLEQLCHL